MAYFYDKMDFVRFELSNCRRWRILRKIPLCGQSSQLLARMIFIFLKGLIFQRSLNGIKNNRLKRRICSWLRVLLWYFAGVGKKFDVHHARGLRDIHASTISMPFTGKSISIDDVHLQTSSKNHNFIRKNIIFFRQEKDKGVFSCLKKKR